MAAIKIPDALKEDMPQNKWGKVFVATPVVMTVIATMLAGLANSEMTKAQYDRSLGAQMQSKAGDQWGFFQAKRLRGSLQRSTLDILGADNDARSFDATRLLKGLETLNSGEKSESLKKSLLEIINSQAGKDAVRDLAESKLPVPQSTYTMAAEVSAVLALIEEAREEEEIAALLSKISDATLASELKQARHQVRAFDEATKPVNQAIDRIDSLLSRLRSLGADPSLVSEYSAARIRYTAQRYDAEARLNQQVASLLELQVRKANLSAERHHRRSQRFFYGMLAAQFGAIASTFAIATQKRNLLWGLSAAAGFLALSVATYVYIFI